MRFACVLGLILGAGCSGVDREALESLDRDITQWAAPEITQTSDIEARIAARTDPETLVRFALIHNPSLREAEALARAAMERIAREGALDAPKFKFEWWAVPLDKPGSFDKADTLMYGVSQMLPFPGKLKARSLVALREAEMQFQMARMKEREIVQRVRKAFWEYWLSTRDLLIHQEHVRLMEQIEAMSKVLYTAGSVSQQDVLRSQVSLVMLHNEVLFIQQRIGSAKAMLNSLLGRSPESALGPPADSKPSEPAFERDALLEKAKGRPEARLAELSIKRAEAAEHVADQEATLPDFELGVDYWQMPLADGDAWGGMLSVSLPWLSPQKRAERTARQLESRAARMNQQNIQNQIAAEITDALLRLEAARRSLALYQGELEPKARQAVEVARGEYEKALGTFINLIETEAELRKIQLGLVRANSDLESAIIDLERAVGADLRSKP